MTVISASEARATLPELLDRVLRGEEVTITRHGREVAVLVRPDALVARRADRALADAERLRNLLDRGRSIPLAAAPPVTSERADELAASVRADRAER